MTYLKGIPSWGLLIGMVLLGITAKGGLQADLTDDFSFSLTHTTLSTSAGYSYMSEKRVAEIFKDHLRGFPVEQAPALARHLVLLCKKHQFDPAFVLSLIQVESTFNAKIASHVGAIGLMQLMPATAQGVAKKFGIRYSGEHSLRDPFTNLSLGIAYLSVLRDKYRGVSPYYHVAAYNIGPGKLDRLMLKKSFRPDATKVYYEKIRNGVPKLRYYQSARELTDKPASFRDRV